MSANGKYAMSFTNPIVKENVTVEGLRIKQIVSNDALSGKITKTYT